MVNVEHTSYLTNIYCYVMVEKIVSVLQVIYISICTTYLNLGVHIYTQSCLSSKGSLLAGLSKQHCTSGQAGQQVDAQLQPASLGALRWPNPCWKTANEEISVFKTSPAQCLPAPLFLGSQAEEQ